MNIDSIKNGFVIDHITAGRGMRLYDLLGLDNLDCSVAIIKNVASKKMGKKDIIKIDADIELNTDILGYIDPNITVNVIKDGVIAEKKHVELPEMLKDVISCKNPRCIAACPVGIQIPSFIEALKSGDVKGAAEIIAKD